MKTYLVIIETRKGDRNDTLGPFSTFEKAQDALKGHVYCKDIENYTKFGSDFSKGKFYTEDEACDIIEREME